MYILAWQLAFKVVSGNWDSAVIGYSSFWELFASTDTYNTASPVPDQRDFSTSSDHYKSELVQQWEDGYISVQAVQYSSLVYFSYYFPWKRYNLSSFVIKIHCFPNILLFTLLIQIIWCSLSVVRVLVIRFLVHFFQVCWKGLKNAIEFKFIFYIHISMI